ncbi:MAG: hypothetical protein IPM29_26385 [Planctomycetes bacterium]|nr:hypothetical protein [Planctomycetota bacterium]
MTRSPADPGPDETLRWADWDETVLEPGEEPAHDGLPAERADREALLDQRLVHGLLTMLQDSREAREARVRRIVAAIPARADRRRALARPWVALAAAAVILVALALVFGPRSMDRLQVEAMLREVAEHSFPAASAREFLLTVRMVQPDGTERQTGRHVFVCGGHGRFRAELDGEIVGRQTLGSDGETVWRESHTEPPERISAPLRDARRVLGGVLPDGGFFGCGHLEVGRLLERLPGAEQLEYAGTEVLDEGGPELVRLEGEGLFTVGEGGIEHAVVLVDEERELVEQVELRIRAPDGSRCFVFVFREQSPRPVDPAFFARPW